MRQGDETERAAIKERREPIDPIESPTRYLFCFDRRPTRCSRWQRNNSPLPEPGDRSLDFRLPPLLPSIDRRRRSRIDSDSDNAKVVLPIRLHLLRNAPEASRLWARGVVARQRQPRAQRRRQRETTLLLWKGEPNRQNHPTNPKTRTRTPRASCAESFAEEHSMKMKPNRTSRSGRAIIAKVV